MTFSSQNSALNHADMPSTVAEMKAPPLGAAALHGLIIGKPIKGLYRAPFFFDMLCSPNGTLWGRNNYGTEDNGKWSIAENGEMTVSWQSYWDAHTTHIYADGNVLQLFDTDTGNWRSCMIIPAE